MAKKTVSTIVFLLMIGKVCFSQSIKLISDKKQIELIKYEIDTSHKIFAIYKDTSDATVTTPEQMLISNLSANSQEWVNYNTYMGKRRAKIVDADFLKSQENIKKNNAYNLSKSKLYLKLDSFNIVLYKFYFVNPLNEKKISAVITMIKKGGRYYITTFPELMDLSFVLLSLNDEILKKTLSKQKIENQDLIKNIYAKNGIDLSILKTNFSILLDKIESTEREYLFDKNSIFY